MFKTRIYKTRKKNSNLKILKHQERKFKNEVELISSICVSNGFCVDTRTRVVIFLLALSWHAKSRVSRSSNRIGLVNLKPKKVCSTIIRLFYLIYIYIAFKTTLTHMPFLFVTTSMNELNRTMIL